MLSSPTRLLAQADGPDLLRAATLPCAEHRGKLGSSESCLRQPWRGWGTRLVRVSLCSLKRDDSRSRSNTHQRVQGRNVFTARTRSFIGACAVLCGLAVPAAANAASLYVSNSSPGVLRAKSRHE